MPKRTRSGRFKSKRKARKRTTASKALRLARKALVQSKPELKYRLNDESCTGLDDVNPWCRRLISAPDKGTGSDTRIGREIAYRKVFIKGTVRYPISPAYPTQESLVRLTVVMVKENDFTDYASTAAGGTMPLGLQPNVYATIHGYPANTIRNHNFKSDLRVLWTKKIVIRPDRRFVTFGKAFFWGPRQMKYLFQRGTNFGGPTVIQDKCLYMLVETDALGGHAPVVDYTVQSFYTDN